MQIKWATACAWVYIPCASLHIVCNAGSIDRLVASAYKPSTALLRSTQRQACTGATPGAAPAPTPPTQRRNPLESLRQPWGTARVLTYRQSPASQSSASPLLPPTKSPSPRARVHKAPGKMPAGSSASAPLGAQTRSRGRSATAGARAALPAMSGLETAKSAPLPLPDEPESKQAAGGAGNAASLARDSRASQPSASAAPSTQQAPSRRHTLAPGSPATRMRQFLASTDAVVTASKPSNLRRHSYMPSRDPVMQARDQAAAGELCNVLQCRMIDICSILCGRVLLHAIRLVEGQQSSRLSLNSFEHLADSLAAQLLMQCCWLCRQKGSFVFCPSAPSGQHRRW
jgi:hypothetical protein